MASVQQSVAENGVDFSADLVASDDTDIDDTDTGEMDAGIAPLMPDDSIVTLLVAKRATARQLRSALPNAAHGSENAHDVVLDSCIGPDEQIRLIVVTSQRAALQRVKLDPPRAVLVEVDSRPQSRVRFCRVLRSRVPAMAVLAVGLKQPESPFAFDGFLAQPLTVEGTVAAIQKLDNRFTNHVVECGPFQLNLATRTLYTPAGSRHMTPKLCALLELLMQRRDEIVSRGEIMEFIWETSYMEDTRTLDVHIRWLREYIEPDPSTPRYILTERGAGYTFQA